MKTCTKCNIEKSLTEFNRRALGEPGLKSRCKSCLALGGRKYSIEKRDKISSRKKEYCLNGYVSSLPVRSVEERLTTAKNKTDVRRSNRRASELQSIPKWDLDEEFNEFLISEIYHLAELRSKVTGVKHHVDHIVPLNSKLVCGFHHSCNLQILTATENMKKSNKFWPDMP